MDCTVFSVSIYYSDDVIDPIDDGYSSSESEEETAAEKKLRLAKQYLAQIEHEGQYSLGRKIVNIFLPIHFSICLRCSKEPSH